MTSRCATSRRRFGEDVVECVGSVRPALRARRQADDARAPWTGEPRWPKSASPRPAQRHDDRARGGADARLHDGRARLRDRQRAEGRARAWPWTATAPGHSIDVVANRPTRPPASTASAPCITSRWRSRPAKSSSRLREELAAHGRAGDDGARSLLLPVDLLPRARRRAVRSGDDAAGLRGRRVRRSISAAA